MIRIALTVCLLIWGGACMAQDSLRMAVTTSFHNSGLADVLLPAVREELGIEVQLLVVGTGQAIKLGQAGDVDALLVHSRAAEEAFVAAGFAPYRRPLMYNDFVLVGPQGGPDLRTQPTAAKALAALAELQAPFVSRGDESGTHKAEQALWAAADLAPARFGPWYREVGAGMGAALNTASALGAYTLSDRASWLNFRNKGGLSIVFEGDPALFNQYAFLPVDAERHPHVKSALVARLEDWLTDARAAALINGYRIEGVQLFTFNARPRP